MRYVRFGIIALAVAILATIGGARVDDTAQAQTPSLAPQNVQATDGANLGEVVVTWDAVADAKYYRIGWLSLEEFYAVRDEGRTWEEAFFFVVVENVGQNSHLIRRLEPGVWHYFTVAGMASQYSEPHSSQATTLTLQSTAPGDYDADNNGLIEISSLAQLDAVRYDTDGDGNVADQHYVLYTQAFTDPRFDMGCPSDGCHGYELAADLDFDTNGNGEDDAGDDYWNDGKGWEPIGDFEHPFTATFDGNSRTISNLHINRPTEDEIGFFGRADVGNVIRNVTLASVNVTGDAQVGGLVGSIWNSTISDSSVSGGSVTGTGYDIGGLVGHHQSGGTITNSHATATVSGDRSVGGLVGYNEKGQITGSSTSGSVSGTGRYIGGLVGDSRFGGTVTDSSSTATVSGDHQVGGLIGYVFGTGIVRSHATGSVTSVEYEAGGLVGRNYYGLIITSYANGNVSGGGNDVGGLIGDNVFGIAIGSHSTGSVSGGSDNVGGLAGRNYRGNFLGVYATGNVSGSGNGNDDIGGLVGDNSQGNVRRGYAVGSVSGTGGGADQIGGLVAHNRTGGLIELSYSIGSVTETSGSADAKVGGLVGENSGDVTDSYWDTQTSGLSTSDGGEGKTTAELQTPTDDTGIYAEWRTAWDYGTSSQYPVLRHYGQRASAQR